MKAIALCLVLALANSAFSQIQLMPQQKLAAMRAMLPALEDEDAHADLHDPRLILYTNEGSQSEMPPAYQHQPGNGHQEATLHSPYYNISADPSDSGRPHGSGGNANITSELAWAIKPGGAVNSPSVLSVKGFRLPVDNDGRVKPVAIWKRDVRGRVGTGNTTRIWCWTFPRGTIFQEILTMRIRDTDYPFEQRSRELVFSDDGEPYWEIGLSRPLPTAQAVADELKSYGEGQRRQEAITTLLTGSTIRRRLRQRNHNRVVAFDETTEVFQMPTLNADDVLQLIDRPFVSAVGETFKDGARAPSNDSEFINIVPPGYLGTFVGNDSASCVSCHESVARHSTEFEAGRGWYGRVRGGGSSGAEAGILSWHPFEPGSISYNGTNIPVRLRQAFVRAGMIEMFDPQKHGPEDYRSGEAL